MPPSRPRRPLRADCKTNHRAQALECLPRRYLGRRALWCEDCGRSLLPDPFALRFWLWQRAWSAARAWRRLRPCWAWCRRHPAFTVTAAVAVLLAVIIGTSSRASSPRPCTAVHAVTVCRPGGRS